MTQATFSAKEVARTLGLDPKRFRAFVRTQAGQKGAVIGACGQGNRYGITKAQATALVAAYRKAHPNHVMPKAAAPKAPRKARTQAQAVTQAPQGDDVTQAHANEDVSS